MKKAINWEKQIKSAAKTAEKYGFTIDFKNVSNGVSEISIDDKQIIIHTGHNHENQFYCLLHELGHFLIPKNHKSYYSKLLYCNNNFTDKSLTKKIALLDEELKAWDAGADLARQKKWKIDKRNYYIFRAKMIKTYINWIAR